MCVLCTRSCTTNVWQEHVVDLANFQKNKAETSLDVLLLGKPGLHIGILSMLLDFYARLVNSTKRSPPS